MRTMFIFLILCLAAFTTAQNPPKHTEVNCGKIYKCVAPISCVKAGITVSQSKVMEIKYDVVNDNPPKINADCPAIIRFHSYSSVWLHVEIESFTTATTSIVFTQKQSDGTVKTEFSCEKNGASSKVEGKFSKGRSILPNDKSRVTSNDIPLKCIFQVRKNEILKYEAGDNLMFTINLEKTIEDNRKVYLYEERCDPSQFNFIGKTDHTKAYAEVKVEPGKYSCGESDSIYKMIYRDITSAVHIDVKQPVECESNQFKIDGVLKPVDYDLNIGCVADVQFLCDYNVKEKSGKKPVARDPPNKAANKPGKLYCPKSHPFFMFEDQPFRKAEFECRYFGEKSFWTFQNNILSEVGPEVYCEKNAKCNLLFSISESAVENGFVNQDYLPMCQGEGKLLAGGKNVNRTWCDGESGDFKYSIKGEVGEHTIDASTQFRCQFEIKEDTEQNIKNTEMIKNNFLYGAIGGIGIIILCFLIFGCFMFCRWKRNLRKAAMADRKVYNAYGLGNDEKMALKQKNKMISQSSSNESGKEKYTNWKEMVMAFRCKCWAAISTPNGDGRRVPFKSETPQSDFSYERLKEIGPMIMNMKKTIHDKKGNQDMVDNYEGGVKKALEKFAEAKTNKNTKKK